MQMDRGADSYRRYRKGDWDGLREISEDYYCGLVAFLSQNYVNSQDAEDIAEETLLVLAERQPEYEEGIASFKTWLYRIARNLAVDYLRKKEKEVLYMPEDFEGFEALGGDVGAELIREKEQQSVRAAMQRLRKKYRQVLWMKYFAGMNADEMAVLMNKSTQSVYGLLKRAKEKLRTELEKEGLHERSR